MSIAIVAETGTIISSLGVATMGALYPIAAMIDHDLEENLSQGTTQMVMAVFIVMLVVCVVKLFTILQKKEERAHMERDDRERRFHELMLRVETAVQENTKATTEFSRVSAAHILRHDIEADQH